MSTITDPNDPRHGRYSGWQAHWRHDRKPCEPCRRAFRRYQNKRAKEANLGYVRRVPTGPVRDHVLTLRSRGVTVKQMVDLSGVGRHTIQELCTKPRATMTKDLADALLAVNPTPDRHGRVDPTGTRRRIQALATLGYSYAAIEREMRARGHKTSWSGLRNLVVTPDGYTSVATATAVADVYETLSMRLPPANRSTTQVRSHATRMGWVPPMAWLDIDDPTERPDKGYRPGHRSHRDVDPVVVDRLLNGDRTIESTRAEKDEVTRRWLLAGRGSKAALSRMLGWKEDRYWPVRFVVTVSGVATDLHGVEDVAGAWPHAARYGKGEAA